MKCPFCNNPETQVKDSRPTEDGSAIRRRRLCLNCGSRFTSFERIQLRDLTVIKKDGKRTPFNRDKLANSILIALRKRRIESERVEKMISGIVRRLESSGEVDIPSNMIGKIVMESLSEIDQVAYVRFASVYRNFREVQDFENFLGELKDHKK
tara:strand:- start:829 stop:1287 length:459 start_codon:yes stop_codon:yes gene_type:complete